LSRQPLLLTVITYNNISVSNKCSLGEHKRLLSETIVTLLLYDFYKCGCFLQVYFTFGYKFAPQNMVKYAYRQPLTFAL